MKSKIFNGQGVQAIIAGNKTMFREVVKPQLIQPEGFSDAYFDCYNKSNQWNWWTKDDEQLMNQIVKCPYQVGQEITPTSNSIRWRLKLFNTELQIKEIRVERLADISEEDAIAEDSYLDRCECLPRKEDKYPVDAMFKQNFCYIHGQEFKYAWNATHKKPEEKFEASPWVWVIDFEVVK